MEGEGGRSKGGRGRDQPQLLGAETQDLLGALQTGTGSLRLLSHQGPVSQILKYGAQTPGDPAGPPGKL